MAHFLRYIVRHIGARLAWIAVAAILALIGIGNARALVPAIEQWDISSNGADRGSTPDAACQNYMTRTGFGQGTGYTFIIREMNPPSASQKICNVRRPDGTDRFVDAAITRTYANCANGSVPINGQCPDPPPVCTNGQAFSGFVAASYAGGPVCFGSCQANPVTVSNQCAVQGVQKNCGDWEGNGVACSGQTVAATTPAPQTCPVDKCPGTINGQFACLACSTANPARVIETGKTTNADGSSSSTTTTTISTATTTTISNVTINYGANGAATGTETSKESKLDDEPDRKTFCEENPGLSICQTSTFAGSCGAFVCTGDAVQCAIGREQHDRNCTLFVTPTGLSDAGNAAAAGTDSGATDNPASEANREVVDLAGTIDQSTFLASGCLSDQLVSLGHFGGVSLPFSRLCPYLEILGALVVAASLIGAARIVGLGTG